MSNYQVIDSSRLTTDRMYRIKFLRDFIQFRKSDAEALNRLAPIVAPLVPLVVDSVYTHLFQFSNTKGIFLRRSAKFNDVDLTKADTEIDPEQMATNKDFLSGWAVKVFTSNFDDNNTWAYLDRVGEMHSGVAGFKHRAMKQPLFVDLVLCSALLGWVESTLIEAVLGIPDETVPKAQKVEAVLAINKLLWIQNDLFARHYLKEGPENISTAAKGAAAVPEPPKQSKTQAFMKMFSSLPAPGTAIGLMVLAAVGGAVVSASKSS
jgi:hypothetical protein